MTERSIYAYDPRLIPEREMRRKADEIIAESRGTRSLRRLAGTWIGTCTCGALLVTQDNDKVALFATDHEECAA